MNVDELTIGEVKQLTAMIGGSAKNNVTKAPAPGRYVLVVRPRLDLRWRSDRD